MSNLPTADEMLANAAREMRLAVAALDGAAGWLRSDWRPVGSELTDAQEADRDRMSDAITAAKRAINGGEGPTVSVDLDDTGNCPKAEVCVSCGATEDLEVVTATTAVGVLCATVCASCSDGGRLPNLRSWVAAMDAVARHCGHLGIDVDQMAAILEAGPE